jgi:hypothetical protein
LIYEAIEWRARNCVEVLCNAGVSLIPNENFESPLMMGCKFADKQIVKILLDNGADCLYKTNNTDNGLGSIAGVSFSCFDFLLSKPICGKEIIRMILEHQNTKLITEKEKKAFKWSICDKRFSQKGNLKTHVASFHERKRAFKCGICDERFSQNGSLKRHMISRHESRKSLDGNKPFKCFICNYSCYDKSDLKKHFDSVHEGKKAFKCEMCGKRFSQKGHMNRHIASSACEERRIDGSAI